MTETSRRALLRAGALAAAAAPVVAPLVTAAPAAAASGSATPGAALPGRSTSGRQLYRRSRFSPLLGAGFTVVEPARRWSMRLTDVGDLSPGQPDDDRCFTLTFTLRTPGPSQGTFLVRRTGFPATTLFLVPSDNDRRSYQAIVNTR
ncbi:DUF6916 family protein [Nocardioides sp. T2.26MG-1]|uniref:DUF6916 family protein n=1 Tax=Nocardioides sp. T2.26MG-1 TaxID=3041166 RepID=UPI00247755B9|nr:hypothetical protein [Nocardioides sp. T2.26MG-1]CAI9412575.1 hypothetical protein HIDPHFAB_01806 [Nocardioides sp. T2.26MG-1]